MGILICFSHPSIAGRVSGKVYTSQSLPLPFASILVKGTTRGTTANSKGEYFLDLQPGRYILVCQHVGYEKREKEITVGDENVEFNFVLKEVNLSLEEVVIRPGGEDPAYEIIRQAVKKRPEYQNQVRSYQCEVYIKGQIRLKDFPKSFLGQPIDLEDGDSSKNKIVFLSETIARFSFSEPDKKKVEVISTRVSGQSNGFGFSNPDMISFYDNNVQLPRQINPRGFISPIADNALYYYRYKYRGAFFEDGKQINRIEVIPKRPYEPVFSGYIQIVENEWRIHSVQLKLTKTSQIEFLNSVLIDQLYVPVNGDVWMVQSQTVYPEVKMFGFDASGYFTTLYSDYRIEPPYTKKFFNRTILRYDSISNKRSKEYWDSIRPVPLLEDELADFRKKDSLEQLRLDPKYLDSLDKRQNRITAIGIFLNGQTLQRRSKELEFEYDPVLKSVSFNSVEGWSAQLSGTFTKSWNGRKSLSVTPVLRYGFNNRHFNAFLNTRYRFGNKYFNEVSMSGGKRIYQFNNTNPIPQILNTFTTLLDGNNYMKIYEARFLNMEYSKGIGEGFTIRAGFNFQDRLPLENTDSTTFWGRSENKSRLTPNYPTEISGNNIIPHQAFQLNVMVSFRPGTRYIELPDRKINIGSKYPLFTIRYTRGLNNVLGSDVEFDRWRFSIQDNINFKVAGEFRYNMSVCGFFSAHRVELPDYQHFNGNLVSKATPYLNSFQLLPYYALSNKDKFYALIHAEHRFNGFLTNKIPVIRRFNLRLVAGTNMYFSRTRDNYYEVFTGLDNILKIFRFDYVWSFNNMDGYRTHGLRIGIRAFNTLFNDY